MLKKALSEGLSTILRQLDNSNVEKVLIVKWSQNLICVDISTVSGSPKDLQDKCISGKFDLLGFAKEGTSVPELH